MTTHHRAGIAPCALGERREALPHRSKIGAAAWMVTAMFILSNSATPLYVHWQRQFAFSSATLTLVFGAYIVGLLCALLVAGQLSDRQGRKAVLVPGFLIAMVACCLFITAASVAALAAARFLTGVAVGIVVSAGMAAVVDAGGAERKRQAALAASLAMVIGAGLGPLLAGMLAQLFEQPVRIIFGTELVLLASALAVAATLPASGRPRAIGAAPARRLGLPSVAPQYRRELAVGIAVFAPAMLSSLLHVQSPLVAGGTACLMFMCATAAQFAVKRSSVRAVLLLGAAATAVSMAAMIVAVHAAMAPLLLSAAALAGVGQGLGQLGGLTALGTTVPDQQRAQANALLNIGAYIPAGILPLAAGLLADRVGLALGATIFGFVLIGAAAAAARFVIRQMPR
jgi:hypothetical protein